MEDLCDMSFSSFKFHKVSQSVNHRIDIDAICLEWIEQHKDLQQRTRFQWMIQRSRRLPQFIEICTYVHHRSEKGRGKYPTCHCFLRISSTEPRIEPFRIHHSVEPCQQFRTSVLVLLEFWNSQLFPVLAWSSTLRLTKHPISVICEQQVNDLLVVSV